MHECVCTHPGGDFCPRYQSMQIVIAAVHSRLACVDPKTNLSEKKSDADNQDDDLS